jgi:hypothetical protein
VEGTAGSARNESAREVPARAGLDPVVIGLVFFGVTTLVLGLSMAFIPGTFFKLIGPFGVRNDHFIRDTASFEIALAVLLLVAVQRPSWRVPALVTNAVQWGLHSINHLIDIGNANPTWVGYFDFFNLLAGAIVLTLLALRASRQEAAGYQP